MPKLRMMIRTARGELTVVVDILMIISGLHMVELHKGAAGDAASFYQYYSELLPLVRWPRHPGLLYASGCALATPPVVLLSMLQPCLRQRQRELHSLKQHLLLLQISSVVHGSSFQPASLARLSASLAPPLLEPGGVQSQPASGFPAQPAQLDAVSPPETPLKELASPVQRPISAT